MNYRFCAVCAVFIKFVFVNLNFSLNYSTVNVFKNISMDIFLRIKRVPEAAQKQFLRKNCLQLKCDSAKLIIFLKGSNLENIFISVCAVFIKFAQFLLTLRSIFANIIFQRIEKSIITLSTSTILEQSTKVRHDWEPQ